MVEGVKGAIGRDRQLEPVAETVVLDLDGQRVLGRVPEQQDVDAVALAGGELAGSGGGCGAHEALLLVARGGHGITTSLTLVAVVRSATKNGSSASASSCEPASTVHQIAWPPERHEAKVDRWRSGLWCPLNEANTTPHSCGSWLWWSR